MQQLWEPKNVWKEKIKVIEVLKKYPKHYELYKDYIKQAHKT